MNVMALAIIMSWVTMTISLAVANFPTVYARERKFWGWREKAMEDAKMITGFMLIIPIAWIPYLIAPTIKRIALGWTEDRVPEDRPRVNQTSARDTKVYFTLD